MNAGGVDRERGIVSRGLDPETGLESEGADPERGLVSEGVDRLPETERGGEVALVREE